MIKVTAVIEPTLKGLRSVARSFAPAQREVINRKIAAQYQSWVFRNFDSAGSLRSPPWAPLKPSTLRQKIAAGYSTQPLKRTGALRTSFLGFATPDTVGIGARASFGVDYAEVHEYGAPERNIPARPMLPEERYALEVGARIYGQEMQRAIQSAGLSS